MPGRFVFMFDDESKKIRPILVAVKSASVLKKRRSMVEALYQQYRQTTKTSERHFDNEFMWEAKEGLWAFESFWNIQLRHLRLF